MCGLTCGFLALVASASGDFINAAKFIVTAIFFDGFDGAAARALRVEGPFGEMMDSLADLVVFGVAPAFLAYQANLRFFGTTGMPGIAGALAAAAFVGCGAIRLARFPLVKNKRYFVGLPIPMAGAFLAMLGVYAAEIPPSLQVVVPAATVGVAAMMVSTIQFPKFKTAFGPLPAFARWGLCLSMAPVLFVWQPKAILVLLVVYLALGPAGELRTVLERDQHGR